MLFPFCTKEVVKSENLERCSPAFICSTTATFSSIVPGSEAAETHCACFMREGLRGDQGQVGTLQRLLENCASWGQRLWGDILVGFSSLNYV